jgi:hypothetical protein
MLTHKFLTLLGCLLLGGMASCSACSGETALSAENGNDTSVNIDNTGIDTAAAPVQNTAPSNIVPQLEIKGKLTAADMTDARIYGLLGNVKKITYGDSTAVEFNKSGQRINCGDIRYIDGEPFKIGYCMSCVNCGNIRYIDDKHYSVQQRPTFDESADSIIYVITFGKNIRKDMAVNLNENVEHGYVFDKYGRLISDYYKPDYSSEGWGTITYEYAGNGAFPIYEYDAGGDAGVMYQYLEFDGCNNWTKRIVKPYAQGWEETKEGQWKRMKEKYFHPDENYTQTRIITYYK